ncbi:MAG: hypothetical protein H6954_02290 [Chromatiaceae bacterium]|nr:hypothetical protein [Chromatiaceae bacterium]
MEADKLKTVVETADLLNRALRKVLVTDRGLHAETLVAAASRMAGTLLLREVVPEVDRLEPGTVVLSDAANRRGPELINTLLVTLAQLGHGDIDQQRLAGSQATTAMSRLTLAETQRLLEPWYRKIADVAGLSLIEVAAAAAMTTALVIHDCCPVLDVQTGCSIAIHGLVESTRTVPLQFAAAR